MPSKTDQQEAEKVAQRMMNTIKFVIDDGRTICQVKPKELKLLCEAVLGTSQVQVERTIVDSPIPDEE